MSAPWLTVTQGQAPLLISLPHTGTDLCGLDARLASVWLASKDTDWWIDQLYDFASGMGASVVHTAVSRSVIDVNRDPSGHSLYPGLATTALCPVASFDGECLYHPGGEPDQTEILARRASYSDPYHAALTHELARLRACHGKVVLYDCHSIRSMVPRLFDGLLPVFNLGTNEGASADPSLVRSIASLMADSGQSHIIDGRFKGGFITRHFGRPAQNIHAVQMELACRAYMTEPQVPGPGNWPPPYDPGRAAVTRRVLAKMLEAALAWASA